MAKRTDNNMRSKMRKQVRTPKQILSLFKKPLFWVVAFILLALATYAILKTAEQQNRSILPAPGFEEDYEESICGNGLIEAGEDCDTCYIDSPCAQGQICSLGACMKEKFNLLVLTIPAIILAILAIGLLGYQILEFREKHNEGKMQRLSGLMDYISKSMSAGQKETEIMINVIRAGWDKSDASEALKEVKKSLSSR